MFHEKKVVAFIPARGGSKGIPEKNIKIIHGKPLIAWSIEQALSSDYIDDVYVSTDDEKIRKIAIDYGAKAPFTRPSEISTDDASTESAMLHFCSWLDSNNKAPESIVLLQPTSPVRAKNRIDDAYLFFKNGDFDSALSVTLTHKFFWKINSSGNSEASYDYMNRPRRQDIKNEDLVYQETGSIYICNYQKFLHEKNRLFGKIGMYLTPENESYEIDSMTDFIVCEELLKLTDI